MDSIIGSTAVPPKETLNPYKLLVAVLIREYVRLRRDLSPDMIHVKINSPSKEKEREDCKNYLSRHGVEPDKFVISGKESFDTLKLLQHLARSPERDFASLICLIRCVLVRAHLLLFRRVVEMLRKDDQEETGRYVDINFPPLLQSLRIEQALCSLFMRNTKILFDELSYTGYDRFSSHLLDYIGQGFHYLLDLDSTSAYTFEKADRSSDVPNMLTATQSSYFLAQESALMQRNPVLTSGNPGDNATRQRLLTAQPPIESANYVRFLQAVHAKDYSQAVDALYKFFASRCLLEEKTADGAGVSYYPGETNLQLCIMHYDAGHHELALQALRECIYLAQEKSDIQLLSHAMFWLACLEINNNQYEKLFRGASLGDFARFPEVAAQFAVLIARFDSLLGMEVKKVVKHLDYVEQTDDSLNRISLMQHYSGRATFFKLYGVEEVATVYAQGCVQLFCRPENSRFPLATDSAALCASMILEHAVRFNDQKAIEIMQRYCRERFPPSRFGDWKIWGLSELFWKYQLAFNRQDYSECEILNEQIGRMNVTEASVRKAQLLYYKDCSPKSALELLDALLKSGSEGSVHVAHLSAFSLQLQLRLLLLKAEIFLRCQCGLHALKCVIEALGLVKDHPNELWKWKVHLLLAYVWFELDEMGQAAAALDVCFPGLNGCKYAQDEGRVWYLKGKLLLSEKEKNLENPEWAETLLNYFERALEAFAQCSAVSDMMACLCIMGFVYNDTDNIPTRDHCSKLYKELCTTYPHVVPFEVDA